MNALLLAIGARLWFPLAVACLVIGVALGRWSKRTPPDQHAAIDSLKFQGALLTLRTNTMLTAYALLRDSLAAEQQARAQDLVRHADLLRRRMPTRILAAHPVPDTCAPIVTQLVDQLAIRDSIRDLDSASIVRLTAAVASWDRVAAGLANAAIEEQGQRLKAEGVAINALKRSKEPFVRAGATVFTPLDQLSANARLWATARISEHARLRAEREWRSGEAARWLVGGEVSLRILQ